MSSEDAWPAGLHELHCREDRCVLGCDCPCHRGEPVPEFPLARGSRSLDRIAAGHIEDAGNIVSGLILDEIGESGHGMANKLWKIAAYLRQRDR